MEDRSQLLALLQAIELEMRAQFLWEMVSPPVEAFESQLPFCVDTMRFSQWLQWVFIARFQAIIEGGHPLPARCNIAVMAEEAFKGMEDQTAVVIDLLRQFDDQFTDVPH